MTMPRPPGIAFANAPLLLQPHFALFGQNKLMRQQLLDIGCKNVRRDGMSTTMSCIGYGDITPESEM